ncbi:hypothetical protein FBU31_003547 [Coemansia sp. 'formosensis']|nr:hypothetical protein FBU31_003547 [Coemansia sp. 'formosensis']
MKSARRPEKESPPASGAVGGAATATKAGTVGANAGRNKPNYGLRLKPELLALTGDTPPLPPSPTTKSASKTSVVSAPTAHAKSATTTSLAATTLAAAAAGKKPAKAEIDFIDFFSSIDDEDTATATNELGAPNAATATAAFGFSTPMDGNSGFVGGQHAVANNAMMVQGGGGMTDFDAMFHALSNPFAAQQQQQQQQQSLQAGVVSSASPFADMSTSNIGSSSNVSSAALGMQQQLPFGGYPTAANNTATTVSSSTMQFTSFGNTTGATSTPFQTSQQQLGSSSSGFGDVSVNNPFRQSMYPAQPDLMMQQAMMTNQMAQLSMQPQSSQQSAYNPFAQRQTVYLGSYQQQPQTQPLGSSSPFATMATTGGGQTADQFASFSAFGNNNNNINAGIMTSTHQQQPQPHQQTGPVNNNNNFADFNFFQ